jgi:ring-1,2-phenylacetyl-CoA epoxidase subunit PaaE
MKTLTLTIVDIIKETNDTLTLCFKQPGLRKIRYKSGQYLTLIFRINGRRYLRPYSFSSSPSVDKTLNITVKKIPNGIVSNHIHDNIKVNDVIEAMEPMGEFVYEGQHEAISDIYLWGAGSGITPLMSIAKEVLVAYENLRVHLIYGNRSEETTIFLKSILDLEEQFGDKFTCSHFHSKPINFNPEVRAINGRISADKIISIFRDGFIDNSLHYICGPEGLKYEVKFALSKFGVKDSNVFIEDFELKKDQRDFEGIINRSVKVQFEDEVFDLEVTRMESVLEGSLNSGIELPYSCQTGNCSTCKGTLLSGQMKVIGVDVSERSDLLENEYLLCCSYPLSDDVFVQVKN